MRQGTSDTPPTATNVVSRGTSRIDPVRRLRKGLEDEGTREPISSSIIGAEAGVELEERHFSVLEWGSVRSVLTFDAAGSDRLTTTAFLKFFDYRGQLFQSARVECPVGTELDMHPFLSACKLHSGVRHCHLEVLHSVGVRARCLLRGQRGMLLQTGEQLIDEKSMRCLPVSMEKSRENFLFLSSMGTTTVRVKLKLLGDKRALESLIVLPAGGNAFLHLRALFREKSHFSLKAGQLFGSKQSAKQGDSAVETDLRYLRISVRGQGKVSLGLLELRRSQVGTEFMCGIA